MADSKGASAWFSDQVTYAGLDIRRDDAVLLQNLTGRPFGARAGRRPGVGGVPTVSGTTITVPPGVCVVDTAATNNDAAFRVSWNAAQTLALTPADSTNPRVDVVYVRVVEVIGNPTTQTIAFGVVAGNAAATPQPPTQLPDGTALSKVCVLGYLNVPKSGSGDAVVTPGPSVVSSGGILPCADADLGGLAKYVGLTVHTESGLRSWNGAQWVTWAPATSVPQLASGQYVGLTGGLTDANTGRVGFDHPLGVIPSAVLLTESGTTPTADNRRLSKLEVVSATATRIEVLLRRTDTGGPFTGQQIQFYWLVVR